MAEELDHDGCGHGGVVKLMSAVLQCCDCKLLLEIRRILTVPAIEISEPLVALEPLGLARALYLDYV